MQIQIKNAVVTVKEQELFTVEAVTVDRGDRIGFVAGNGAGKTTLFKEIVTGKNPRIVVTASLGYLPQAQTDLSCSGGEEGKAKLLEVMQSGAGCLLLDEPSTNLDEANRKWLIRTLRQSSAALLIITHDRSLLQAIAKKIWYIEGAMLKEYAGSYDEFRRFKQIEREKQEQAYVREQKERQKLLEEARKKKERAAKLVRYTGKKTRSDWKAQNYVGSYDAQARKLAQTAKNLEKRLEMMGQPVKPAIAKAVRLRAVGNLSLEQVTLLTLKNSRIKSRERELFKIPRFTIKQGEHIGITGKNGAGKTTLLNFLQKGAWKQLSGYHYEQLSIGYFEQKQQSFKPTQTLLEAAGENSRQDTQIIRTLLGGLGFKAEQVFKRCDQLSGGEKVRLALAQVLLGDHHLLLLDEPNNYLDLEALQILAQFLQDYPGAFLLVSHDRHLIQQATTKVFTIKNGLLTPEALQPADDSLLDLSALIWQRDRLIQDPTADLAQLKQLIEQISRLQQN